MFGSRLGGIEHGDSDDTVRLQEGFVEMGLQAG